MMKVKARLVVLVLLALVLLTPTTLSPRVNVARADTFPCSSSNTVLLIQDSPPRFPAPNHDANGADVSELKARNMPFCTITSDQLASTDLSHFSEVIIASTQNQAFYNNLFPAGSIDTNLSGWVQKGGVLSANMADCAAGGSWSYTSCGTDSSSSYTFIGGVTHVVSFANDNNVTTASHPIITGQYGGTNGGQISDGSCLQDLDCWQYASHGYLTNLPADATIILTESSGPVLIEYHYGDGMVIVSTTSIEWRYDYFQQNYQNLKLLANEIGYQDFKAQCQENDGDGEFQGNHGHGLFHHDRDQCEDGIPNEVSSKDRGDGKNFQSTSIQSSQLDKLTRTVTIVGLGTSGGLPVSYTYVAVEPGPMTPGWVSFTFSDGFTNAGFVTTGTVILHGW
jgi:hypothetical protein